MSIFKYVVMACLAIGAATALLTGCEGEKTKEVPPPTLVTQPETPKVPEIKFTVETQYPHDVMSFTEGLHFHNGQLYESTGSPDNVPLAKSLLGPVDLKTGKIDVKAELDRSIYFGEGSVVLNDKIYQLTYKNQKGFIYDAKTFKNIGTFTYTNREGWGLTTDGKSLIMSDGTSYLYYLDPVSFAVTKTLDVAEAGRVTEFLNELEYIKGYIYANIWMTNTIVKIDPASGDIVGKLDLGNLLMESKTKNPGSLETNGIAYDSISNKIFVTGKLWPTIYEIKFPL